MKILQALGVPHHNAHPMATRLCRAGQAGATWNKTKLKVNCQEKSHGFRNAISAKKLLECVNSIGFLLAASTTSVLVHGFEAFMQS